MIKQIFIAEKKNTDNNVVMKPSNWQILKNFWRPKESWAKDSGWRIQNRLKSSDLHNSRKRSNNGKEKKVKFLGSYDQDGTKYMK